MQKFSINEAVGVRSRCPDASPKECLLSAAVVIVTSGLKHGFKQDMYRHVWYLSCALQLPELTFCTSTATVYAEMQVQHPAG